MAMTAPRSGAKRTIDDLARFGGRPLFEKPLVVGQPNIPDVDAVVDDIRKILTSGVLSNNGPYLQQFERRVAEISETEFCIATCNATSALELVCRGLGLTGEVVLPSYTFIATAHALSWQGLVPVFVDVDPHSQTIDPAAIRQSITSSTSAICGVHLWGNVCDTTSLEAIANEFDLALFFDAAHAFTASRGGVRVGSFGAAEVFSFHATKFVNAFEGGAVVTNDRNLAKALREIRSFGFDSDRQVQHLGINAKMSEPAAAMGLRSLECLDEIRAANRENYLRYRHLLSDCTGLKVSAPLDPDASNCQYVAVQIDPMESAVTRDELMYLLAAENVLTQRYWYPGCHRALPYRDAHRRRNVELPVTEQLAATTLALPTGKSVCDRQVSEVCETLHFIMSVGEGIRDRLGAPSC